VQGRESLNVWAGILGNLVIGPYFFEGHLDGDRYANFLERDLPGLLEEVRLADRPRIVFQQDGAPPHTSLRARAVLQRIFPGRWIGLYGPITDWPPRSPDLSPLDFFLWGYIQSQVYATLPLNREDLRNRILQAFNTVTPEMLQRTRANFMRRLVICAENGGGHIEHIL